ncbi:hypothetical protein Maes01_01711 [Microbulbifer aestuariivivens]|uniref:DUF4136 domain-containing protein n=1 Tax=Microbulbifer aestuariivivens TaxID=1908308 RepID=A0ABP9WSN2_9GAMM
MKYIVFVMSLLFLSGCSSQFTKPHEGVDNAQIRLASIPSNNNFIHEVEYDKCIYGNGSDQIATLGSKANLIRSLSRNGIPLYDSGISDSHQNEVYIPAGNQFAFQFNGVGIAGYFPGVIDTNYGALYSWCRRIVSFTPAPGGLYEAIYDIIEAPNGRKACDVKLFEISKNAAGAYEKVEAQNYNVVSKYCGS